MEPVLTGAGHTPSRDGMPRVAAAIAVAAWGIVVLSAVTLILARPAVTSDLWFFVVDAMVGCVYGLVAGVVLSRRRHVVPGILALTALGGSVTAFAFAYAASGPHHAALPWLEQIANLNGVAWVPGTLGMFLVVPWLVRESRLGWLARAGVALGVFVALGFTICSALNLDVPLTTLAGAVVLVGLITAVEVTWRWARGPVAERIGLGWLAIGTTIMALSFVPLALPTGERLPIWAVPAMHLVAQAFFPAAVLVAVLRQRMWGLDLAVSRAAVAGALTVGLVVLYVVVTTALTRLLPGDGVGQVVGAAAVVIAVQPSRLWLQRRVHRLVHGDGSEPDSAVRRIGYQLSSARTTEELLDGLVAAVGEALRLESASLVVSGDEVAAWGRPTGGTTSVALVHRGVSVGQLVITAPPGESLGGRATRALNELATVVASGVALAQASRDLDDARDRLTTARLEERRTIRRELHDGLGPSLAGIRLGLQAARNLVPVDPAAAGRLLASLQGELDHQVEDVRKLSRNLLPPVLDELGLGAALAELSERHREGGLDVRLHCDVPPGLPTALAAAAYGIVTEAVTNVARHSGSRVCKVSVLAAGDLCVEVVDDGIGLDPSASAGVGSRSMRERAQEQGGTFGLEPRAPHGTRVWAQLPLVAGRRP